jgi:two-component system, LuxR family, response regulator FixJ
MTQPATVFVIDDNKAMQESLSWIIKSVGLPVKIYSNAHTFLNEFTPEQAGCLLLDVRMPGMSGPELQNVLKEKKVTIPVIFISGHADVPLAVRAMKAGAVDFLTKPCNDQVLLESINKAIRLDQKNRQLKLNKLNAQKQVDCLTPREHEVMSYVVEGLANKEISRELNISLKTVEAHRAHVMQKMNVNSLPELVQFVFRYDLITEPHQMI